MMTRKHYEQIAELLGEVPDHELTDAGRARLASRFAEWLRRENPRFDAGRFYEAIGLVRCQRCGEPADCEDVALCSPCEQASSCDDPPTESHEDSCDCGLEGDTMTLAGRKS